MSRPTSAFGHLTRPTCSFWLVNKISPERQNKLRLDRLNRSLSKLTNKLHTLKHILKKNTWLRSCLVISTVMFMILWLDSSVREAADKTHFSLASCTQWTRKQPDFLSASLFWLNETMITSSSGNTSTPIKFVSGNLYIKNNNNMVTFYTNRKLRNPIKLRLWNVTAD